MIPVRRTALALVVALTLYGAGLAAWSTVSAPFRAAYAATWSHVMRDCGDGRAVRMRPLREPTARGDVVVVCRDAASGREMRYGRNVFFRGYVPLVFLVSLVLATPIRPARRLRALLLGLLLLTVVHGLQLQLESWWNFGPKDLTVGVYGVSEHPVAYFFFSLVCTSPTIVVLIPVVVWLGVLAAGGDMTHLLARDAPPQTAPSTQS